MGVNSGCLMHHARRGSGVGVIQRDSGATMNDTYGGGGRKEAGNILIHKVDETGGAGGARLCFNT